MIWQIPAKTFLLGEYIALIGGPAVLLTTTPCFTLSLKTTTDIQDIHQESPAGRWWQQQDLKYNLAWQDPYHGIGGLGASSAQFLGAYLATCHLKKTKFSTEGLMEAYYQSINTNIGLRPSGYDLLAQASQGIVFIDKNQQTTATNHWPFTNLSFILIHTGQKLATHEHLAKTPMPKALDSLATLVYQSQTAMQNQDSATFIATINAYNQQLQKNSLVTSHSQELIKHLKAHTPALAIKGCGAMGADVLALLIKKEDKDSCMTIIANQGLKILATETSIFFV